MSKKQTLNVRVTEDFLDRLDQAAEQSDYLSRSDLARDVLREETDAILDDQPEQADEAGDEA